MTVNNVRKNQVVLVMTVNKNNVKKNHLIVDVAVMIANVNRKILKNITIVDVNVLNMFHVLKLNVE